MKLYYTGASKFLATQQDKDKSLGGFISSSEVFNAEIGNLFGDITKYGIYNVNKPEYRAIAIKNDSNTTLTGLKAYFEYEDEDSDSTTSDNVCDLMIGWTQPIVDSCGDLMSEVLPTIYSKPYTVTLINALGLSNALDLPNLEAGMYLCIYIKRTLNASAKSIHTDEDLVAIMNNVLIPNTIEEIPLTFVWD